MRDDRILPFTRVVAAIVTAILVTAWVVLYLWPEQTDRRFAWTVEPTMTPMLMGAGYGSAALFWARVTAGRRWHTVGLGLLPTTLFTWMLLVATLLHWDKHRGVPPLALGPHHHAHRRARVMGVEPAPGPWRSRCERPAVRETRGCGAHRLGRGHARDRRLVVRVPVERDRYVAVVAHAAHRSHRRRIRRAAGRRWLAIATDGRWSATKAVVETLALGLILLLVAVGRAWGEFDTSRPLTWAYVGGLVGTLAALAVWYAWMERARRVPQNTTGRSIDGSRR